MSEHAHEHDENCDHDHEHDHDDDYVPSSPEVLAERRARLSETLEAITIVRPALPGS